jgi:hypothetical protein
MLLICEGRSYLIDKRSLRHFFTLKGFRFRIEHSIKGLTQDLNTGKRKLNSENTELFEMIVGVLTAFHTQ